MLLETINSPQDLKTLTMEQLPDLAAEIRDFLLETVSTTGGHLGSNLGTVELSIALPRIPCYPRALPDSLSAVRKSVSPERCVSFSYLSRHPIFLSRKMSNELRCFIPTNS